MSPAYRSALVLGLGASGTAAANLLLTESSRVAAVDERPPSRLGADVDALRQKGATLCLAQPDPASVLADAGYGSSPPDVCVISPGVPDSHPWLTPIRQAGIPLLSELELGASRCDLPILAVTGSNGKSTFVKLCGLALELAGHRPVLAGNYGKPLSAVALEQAAYDWIIAEVSSFQLEHTDQFAPAAGVLLNIAPDHLDRHTDMARYTHLKARLFENMRSGQVALVLHDLLGTVRDMTAASPAWSSFGAAKGADYRYEPGRIVPPVAHGIPELLLEGTVFDNPVTGLTVAAALAAFVGLALPLDALQTAVTAYEPLPHRMQTVAEKSGVLFVDDSKATNLAAMCGALRMVSRPVRLVAGGQFKEKDAELPKELLAKTTKRTYLVGESAEILGKAWEDVVSCRQCGGLSVAVQQAWREAEPGDVVLLSPGCASFDQFSGYHERGLLFQSVVSGLHRSMKGAVVGT